MWLAEQAEPVVWEDLAAAGPKHALAERRNASIERAHEGVRAEHVARLERLCKAEK